MPFEALGLSPRIAKAVTQAGYTEPTPIQTKAIPQVLTGHDVIGVAQTGTGKTAAFVLPILEMLSKAGPSQKGAARALIVVPTRELVVQVEQNIRKYGAHLQLRYATVFGGVGEQPQIAALRRGVDVIVATPGRLLDLAGSGHVKFDGIQIVVLDEADRMLDMGFLPPIRQIMKRVPTKRQTLLFSATFSAEIEKTAAEFLTSPRVVQAGKRANPAEGVTQFVLKVGKEQKLSLLLHLLIDSKLESVLVFSRTKHGADKVARKLAASGVPTATLHSNRSQNQRLEALRQFKAGAVRVLVATDIAARGIDVQGISHVINFDFPPQPEDYVHRIGRTGRAHAVGDALSFITSEDETALRALEKFIGRGIPRMTPEGFKPELLSGLTSSRDLDENRPPRPGTFSRGSRPQGRSGESRSFGGGQGAPRGTSRRSSGEPGRPAQPSRPSQQRHSFEPTAGRPASGPSSRPAARRGNR